MNHNDPLLDEQLKALSGKALEDIDHIEIPESLLPENIEIKLRQEKIKKNTTRKKSLITLGSVAACLALITSVVAVSSTGLTSKSGSKDGANGNPSLVSSLLNPENISSQFRPATSTEDVANAFGQGNNISGIFDYKGDANEGHIANGDSGNNTPYSPTNTQVAGIDEGDVIKVDKEHLYLISYKSVLIIKNENGKMNTLATITGDDLDNNTPVEIYLSPDNHYLIVVTSGEVTKVFTFDLSDTGKPSAVDVFTQDGAFNSSRYVDDILYLFTSKSPRITIHRDLMDEAPDSHNSAVNRGNTSYDDNMIPSVDGCPVSPEDIYLPVDGEASSEVIISSVYVSDTGYLDTNASTVLCIPYATVYMGANSIYLMYSDFSSSGGNTMVAKFSYEDGVLSADATASIEGTVPDTFAVSENGEYYYMLVCANSQNNLYVLDKNLKELGSIKDIAPGEDIYAARFLGSMAYFITYKNVDPLFVADLSDPNNPKLLGNVEITGYSEYLHPFGENLLLGIGYETTPTGEGDWVQNDGAKIVMFDVSNPLKPVILDSVTIENSYSSDAAYNYKSVLTNTTTGLIGLPINGMEGNRYMCFNWNGSKFVEEFSVSSSEYIEDIYDFSELRGSYIGDIFFVSSSNGIISFDMTDEYTYVDSIKFDIPNDLYIDYVE